jgi:hypothetical protein
VNVLRLPIFVVSVLATAAAAPAQAWWIQRVPAQSPSNVLGPGLAWEPSLGATLLFGGRNINSSSDQMWSWDGTNWTQLQPAVKPPARGHGGMAYDTIRQRMVLFGGMAGGSPSVDLDDTWEWDGTTWIQRTPLHAPSPRTSFALAFDAARGRTVLFGGLTGATTTALGDTWLWDGADWTQVFPAHSPGARWHTRMAYDAARGRIVLFGGGSQTSAYPGDTWEWDGTDWTQRFPVHAPPGRYAHGLTYDSARGRIVLFGGISSFTFVDDTWEYDGTDWHQVLTAQRPPANAYMPIAYDPVRERIVHFRGGPISCCTYETWELSADPLLASFATFGQGCAGLTGVPTLALASGRPVLGGTMALTFTNLPLGQYAALWIGFSRDAWGPHVLPFDLGAVGMPGCTLYTGGEIVVSLMNWAGTSAWAITIPSDPQLIDLAFFVQALAMAPVNAMGVIVSNAGEARIGNT